MSLKLLHVLILSRFSLHILGEDSCPNGSCEAEACSRCKVTFGDVTVESKLGCGHDAADPHFISGAFDMPNTHSSKACDKQTTCMLSMKTLLKKEMGERRVFEIEDATGLDSQFKFNAEKQQEWLQACHDIRKESLETELHFGEKQTDEQLWFPTPLGAIFPHSLYEHVTERLCAGAGNWGHLRVTRMSCPMVMRGGGDTDGGFVAYHPGSGESSVLNWDALAQGVAHLYLRHPHEGGEDYFQREGEKVHRAGKLEKMKNGSFVMFHSTAKQGTHKHHEPWDRTHIRIHFVTEDLFRAAYRPQYWSFHNGFGPICSPAAKAFFLKWRGGDPARFRPAAASKVLFINGSLPATALDRKWPVAHLTVTSSDVDTLLPLFKEAEKIVTTKLRPMLMHKFWAHGGRTVQDRSRLFAWYATPSSEGAGASSQVRVYSHGTSFIIDCLLGCSSPDDLATPILSFFGHGQGPRLPKPASWDYTNAAADVYPPPPKAAGGKEK